MSDSLTLNKEGWGQIITLALGVDISGYSAIALIFQRPVGAEVAVVGVPTGAPADPTTGDITWTSTYHFWNVLGDWKVIGRVTFGTDEVLYTKPYTIHIVNEWT
jgi:hypothetical protein